MDCFATVASLALQHGVPLSTLVDKLSRTRFDPAGFTGNPDLPRATSVMDYIFRWLQRKFLPDHESADPSQLPLMIPPDPTPIPPTAIPVTAAMGVATAAT